LIRRKVPERQLFYVGEELVRPSRTNFYVRLNKAVGHWGTLCEPLNACFSSEKNGCPVDPVVYFKILLVGYLENIVFDTDLAERVADSLAIREFAGYGPTEQTPDHSSISRVRKAFAQANALEPVMEKVVGMCVKAGLVSGEVVAADSVLLPANASLSGLTSVKTGISVREHLKRQREAGQKRSVSNKEFQSPADPDARIATKKGSPVAMYHKATHVTDSKSQIVLSACVTPADLGERKAAKLPLEQAKKRLEANDLKLGTVVADAGYDDAKFHTFVEWLGATPLTNFQITKTPKTEGFSKAHFTYDKENDRYLCPQGKILSRTRQEGGRILYAAQERDCLNCPFRQQCLKNKKRRRLIKRGVHEEARDRNIALCHTEEGRKKLKMRKTVVEPPFAHMKRHGGLALVSCWTTARVQAKATVAAIGWNLIKLVAKDGPLRPKGRRNLRNSPDSGPFRPQTLSTRRFKRIRLPMTPATPF